METLAPPTDAWTTDDAAYTYGLDTWGDGFFAVNAAGHVAVRPDPDQDVEVDLAALAADLRADGVQFPVLVRFQDILRARVVALNEAFRAAIREYDYGSAYTSVYPIKVNQLHEVVEEILEAGRPYGLGLECGSKAELVAALPHLADAETLLVCNGYKDAEMQRLILTAQRLGRRVLPVVEKYDEFERLWALAAAEKVAPRFGVRVQLATRGAGKWASSSGDGSKFGVSIPELLQLVRRLEAAGQTDALQLVHFHLGSQIANIQTLKQAIKEAAQVYASLHARGLAVPLLDVGGGLGVSYGAGYDEQKAGEPDAGEGLNYSLQEYANAVVWTVQQVCRTAGVPAPHLLSESGRALTAHHSVLLVEALAAYSRDGGPHDGAALDAGAFSGSEDASPVLRDLQDALVRVEALGGAAASGRDVAVLLEAYHDAAEKRVEAGTLFGYGYLSLEEKAHAEALFWAVCRAIHAAVAGADADLTIPTELRGLDALLTDQVLCDFSVFQSALDHWAIGQDFPIAPIQRLGEAPTRRGVLVDLTCDSDGKVRRYVGPEGAARSYLPVHALDGEPYLVGFFLMGAYQDIMGDTHNLFGRVTEVHVYADADEPGGYYVEKTLPGMTVRDMLALVQYFPNDLHRRMHAIIRGEVDAKRVRPRQGVQMLAQYDAAFDALTYLRSEKTGKQKAEG